MTSGGTPWPVMVKKPTSVQVRSISWPRRRRAPPSGERASVRSIMAIWVSMVLQLPFVLWTSVVIGAAIDDNRLSGDKGGVRSSEEGHGSDQVSRGHVATQGAGSNGEFACPRQQLRVLQHAITERQTRRHTVDKDLERPEFGGECARQRHDGTLARHVVGHAGIAFKGDAGGDVDNASATACFQQRQDSTAAQKGTESINLHHTPPFGRIDLFKGSPSQGGEDGRVVYENIKTAKFHRCDFRQMGDFRLRCDIRFEAEGALTGPLQTFGGRFCSH